MCLYKINAWVESVTRVPAQRVARCTSLTAPSPPQTCRARGFDIFFGQAKQQYLRRSLCSEILVGGAFRKRSAVDVTPNNNCLKDAHHMYPSQSTSVRNYMEDNPPVMLLVLATSDREAKSRL